MWQAPKMWEVLTEVDFQKVWEDKNVCEAKREVEAESSGRLRQTNHVFPTINQYIESYFLTFPTTA